MKSISCFCLGILSLCFISSCTNDLDEVVEKKEVHSRSVESGRLNPSQASTLMNRLLDAPNGWIYLKELIGVEPTGPINTGAFTIERNGLAIRVRDIQIGGLGSNGHYAISGHYNTYEDGYSIDNPLVLYSEPVYDELEPFASSLKPVVKRYCYDTNSNNASDVCWVCINWEDRNNYESIISQTHEGYK